jgi:acyl-CoA hydrolase
MQNGKPVNESVITMTEMIMPNDTNPIANLMGGNLLRWMDIAGGICAGKHSGAYVVTASVDYVSFKQPIRLGDVITITACVTRAFHTSMEIYIEVISASIKGDHVRKCNDAFFTFVAIDENGSPIPVRPVIAQTDIEKERYQAAQKRRELRLLLSGRIQPSEATEIKSLFA